MKNLFPKSHITLFTAALLLVCATAMPGKADPTTAVLQERFKTATNPMVQKVKATEDPEAKRKIIGNFLTRMNKGTALAEDFVSAHDAQSLEAVRVKIQADYAELNGIGANRVANADLNQFAQYIQQNMEQAEYIYISVGALIIILIILLILL